jgi:hypothetical protein
MEDCLEGFEGAIADRTAARAAAKARKLCGSRKRSRTQKRHDRASRLTVHYNESAPCSPDDESITADPHDVLDRDFEDISVPPELLLNTAQNGAQNLNADFPGRLRKCLSAWEAIGASPTVLGWIRDGYPLEWIEGVRPGRRCEPNRVCGKDFASDEVTTTFVQKAVAEMLACQAIVPINRDAATVISPLSVAPKKEANKYRLILDLRYVNSFIQPRSLKMEGLHKARWEISPDDWLIGLDLSSAYYHVEVAEQDRSTMCFEWEGQVYQMRSLPFGLTSAPHCFTKVSKQIVKYWRNVRGWKCIHYIDDLGLWNESKEVTERMFHTAVADLQRLGWQVNFRKSSCVVHPDEPYVPGELGRARQQLEMLGFIINTSTHTFDLTPTRRLRVAAAFTSLLEARATAGHASATLVARCASYMVSTSLALGPLGLLHARNLFRDLDTPVRHRPNCDGQCTKACYTGLIPVSELSVTDIIHFRDVLLPQASGLSIWPDIGERRAVVLYTDASDHAAGAWRPGDRRLAYQELQETMGASSKLGELEAVLVGLQAKCADLPRGTTVLLRVDNQAVYFVIKRGTGDTEPCAHDLYYRIQRFTIEHGIHLIVDWQPRELNLWADFASKLTDHGNWRVSRSFFWFLDARFHFDADLFSSAETRQAHRCGDRVRPLPFYSRWAQPGSTGDARAVDWGTLNCGWAFPPVAMTAFCIRKAWQEHAHVCLVAPVHSQCEWHHWLFDTSGRCRPGVIDCFPLPNADIVAATFADHKGRFIPTHTSQVVHLDYRANRHPL